MDKNKKTVVLFSNFDLPMSCANASRMWSFARMFSDIGFDVKIVGISYKSTEVLTGEYCGFSYEMIQAPSLFGIKAIKRNLVLKALIREKLNEIKSDNVIGIFLSNFYYEFSNEFIRFSKKEKIDLFVNAVEWYDRNNELFKGIGGAIRFIQNRIALYYIHIKMKNIISISSFLDSHYKKRGCRSILIPTVLDMKEYSNLFHNQNNTNRVIISYAGKPAKKDYIVNALLAYNQLSGEEKNRLEMHFYGSSVDDLIALGFPASMINDLSGVYFHGEIPYNEVKNKITASDFTILLRPNRKYANAGFPTKVGESMACGTPVIANLTSDLKDYIIDEKTGIVCRDETVDSCVCALKKVLSLSYEDLKNMRENTKKMAWNSFDYRNYIELLYSFLTQKGDYYGI